MLGAVGWHLAFRVGTQIPHQIDAPVSGPVEISWTDGLDARIHMSSPADLEISLGLVHGLGRPWLMALYRQAALGKLAEWFGSEAVPFDNHVRSLGIPVSSADLASSVAEASMARLDAYATGVRVAQAKRSWDLLPATVEMDAPINPWAPNHSVSIERLLIWLSTEVPEGVSPGLDSLRSDQDRLARLLGVRGLSRAAIWATERQGLFARIVHGDSGIPPILTVSASQNDALVYEGATFPGLPYRICGRSDTASWCKPFASLATARVDSVSAIPRYFDIVVSDGSRVTGSRAQRGGRLAIDSVALAWPGLSQITDADSWFALPTPSSPFRIADASGLAVLPGTGPERRRIERLGRRAFQAGTTTMSSTASEASLLAQRIDLVDDTLTVAHFLLMDTGFVPVGSPDLDRFSDQTVSYLRNWDGLYTPSSIAASIYDLATAFPGQRPDDSLSAWFGTDPLGWRWELDPALRLRYPGTTLAHPANRYGTTQVLRNGHPTSPAWGASRAWDFGVGPYQPETAWEAFIGFGSEPLAIRRPGVPYDSFLGRHRASPIRPALRIFAETPFTSSTRVRRER